MKNLNTFKNRLFLSIHIMLATGSISVAQSCYQTLGTASNAFSIFLNRTNQVIVNNDLNTVIFIHRNDISVYGGDNGVYRYDISTDNGNTWKLDQGNLNPNSTINVNGGRYPQVGIYNPSSNTDIKSATLVYHGPTTNPNWVGYVSGSLLLDGVATSTENYNEAGVSNTNIPGGLCQGVPGTFWTIDEMIDTNTFAPGGFRILKGVYSGGDVHWSVNKELTPDFNLDLYGSPSIIDWNMAFDPTGQIGWVVMLTHLNGLSDYNYHPVFYHTTDGGTTWSGPKQLDLNSFANVTALEPNPACSYEAEITVDKNGNPHAAIIVAKSTGYYSVSPSYPSHLFDFTFNGTSWSANLISQINYTEVYTDGGILYNRPQISRSDDGSKIVYTWTEWNGNDNANLRAVTYDVPTNTLSCQYIYSVKCPSTLNGLMYMPTTSPNMIEDNGNYIVPVVMAPLNQSSGSSYDPCQFYYLNDLSFTDADFTSPGGSTYFPSITLSGSSNFCIGDSVVLTADANSRYFWNTGDTTQSITVFQSGNFWVINPDSGFCIGNTNSVTVTGFYPPYIYANGSTSICSGDSLMLGAGLYYVDPFLWSNGSTDYNIYVSTAGTFYVNQNGCKSNEIVTTLELNTHRTKLTASGPTSFCEHDSVILTADANSNYFWSTGEITQSITVFYGGTYWVVNPDSNYCVNSQNSVDVYVTYAPLIFSSSARIILCNGDTAQLNGYSNYGSTDFLWSTGETTTSIFVNQSGSYTLQSDGCTSLPVTAIAFGASPANDNICHPKILKMGVPRTFDNGCATVEVNEPVPPLMQTNDKLDQTGWFQEDGVNPVLNNTVWFSFIAPKSGAVTIASTFDTYPYDTQLALYKSDNNSCTGNLTLIAANEDGGTVYDSYIYNAKCLDKGKKYFVQLDGYAGYQDYGSIVVKSVKDTVIICHKNQFGRYSTKIICSCHLAQHLAHGDQIGPCPGARIEDYENDYNEVESYQLLAYPNPSSDKMTISFVSDNAENYTIALTDVMGRTILTESKMAEEGENLYELNLNNVVKGIYLVTVKTNQITMQTRVVKN